MSDDKDKDLNQIERRLRERGWTLVGEEPLILLVSLLPHMIVERVDKTGKRRSVTQATLTRGSESRDGWYQLKVELWVQQSDPEAKGEPKGISYQSQEFFEAYCDAVAAGFDRVLTVNVDASVIRFWEKKKSSAEAPAEAQSSPDEAKPAE